MHPRPKRQPIHVTAASLALAALLGAATLPLTACRTSPPEVKIEMVATLPAGADEVDLALSPDGHGVEYKYAKNGKEFVVIDGKTDEPFDKVWGLEFSMDGRHFGYPCKKDGKWFIAIDGKVEGPFDRSWGPEFSADSKTAIFVYQQGQEIFKKTIPLE